MFENKKIGFDSGCSFSFIDSWHEKENFLKNNTVYKEYEMFNETDIIMN